MNRPKPPHNRFQSRLQKSTLRLASWTAAWVLSTAVFAFGPRFLWGQQRSISLLALGANLLVGVGMIMANKNHLKDLDELYQKVMLEAMGITLGVLLIVGVAYSLVTAQDHIAHLLVLASFTFLTSIFFGLRRYR